MRFELWLKYWEEKRERMSNDGVGGGRGEIEVRWAGT